MTPNSSAKIRWLLLAPALVFIGLFFLAPVVALLLDSLRIGDHWGLTLYRDFFRDELNREVYWRTLRIATSVTLVSALICYPAAQAIIRVPRAWRGVLTGLVILPLMISSVARTYSWIVLLGRNGFINNTLVQVGLVDEPQRLLFTEMAVFLGLLQLLMPLMLVSLVSALENLPADLTDAARCLGANGWQAFWKVTLPLTQEGLVVGGVMVFTGCVTAYVTPALLGGPKVMMLETLLYQKVNTTADYGGATVIAVVLLATTLLAAKLIRSVSLASRGRPRAGARVKKFQVKGAA